MDWMKAVTWPVVVLGTAVCALTASLVIWGNASLKDIGTLATTVIAALVLAQQKAAKDQANRIEKNSNGTLEQLRAENRELARVNTLLASKLPPETELPKALSDEQPKA